MCIFFFSGTKGDAENKINKIFSEVFCNEKIVTFKKDDEDSPVTETDDFFKDPLEDSAVSILLPSCKEDLRNIIPRRESFANMRVIIILPDTDQETIELAQKLNPWHINFPNANNYIDVSLALMTMKAKMELAWEIAM